MLRLRVQGLQFRDQRQLSHGHSGVRLFYIMSTSNRCVEPRGFRFPNTRVLGFKSQTPYSEWFWTLTPYSLGTGPLEKAKEAPKQDMHVIWVVV